MTKITQADRLIRHVRKRGFVRPRDLGPLGIPRTVLARLVESDRLVRHSRGIYTAPDHNTTEHSDLAAVTARAPMVVVCLLSALRFHDLTTQNPAAVWIMIGGKSRPPAIAHPPLRIVRASGPALEKGIENHTIEGVSVRITNPAKTVADCFRYRSAIGTDIALEALRDCWRRRKATMDEIHRYARIDRVANVMRPYLETLA